jgi:hypothetical protein
MPDRGIAATARDKVSAQEVLVTIFSVPKPFSGSGRDSQERAIASWVRLGTDCEVMLIGAEDGVEERAHAYGATHIPRVAHNEFGTPLLDSIFATASRVGRGRVLCYINADIVLTSDFLRAIKTIPFSHFLMVGQRSDLDPRYLPDDSAPDWEASLRAQVAARGRLHLPDAIDYFVFTRGLWPRMPPFALGRTSWDNWLVHRARRNGAAVIDATPSVLAVHQDHDYSHHPGGTEGVWAGPEASRNFELAGGHGSMSYTVDSDWVLYPRGVRRPPVLRRLGRCVFASARLHPRWLFLYRMRLFCRHSARACRQRAGRRVRRFALRGSH